MRNLSRKVIYFLKYYKDNKVEVEEGWVEVGRKNKKNANQNEERQKTRELHKSYLNQF